MERFTDWAASLITGVLIALLVYAFGAPVWASVATGVIVFYVVRDGRR